MMGSLRNVELKARDSDCGASEEVARRLSDTGEPTCTMRHRDFYYFCEEPGRRQKLREIVTRTGAEASISLQWVDYMRPDTTDSDKLSEYTLMTDSLLVPQQAAGKHLLCEVRKTRTLYMIGQTRVHLDKVEGLGEFLEFEVVLAEDESTEHGERIIRELKEKFNIKEEALLSASYVDLMLLLKNEEKSLVRRVYVAGRFDDKENVRLLMGTLKRECNVEITHDWTNVDTTRFTTDHARQTWCAEWDTDGVKQADALVVLMNSEPYAYRGTFCEIGIALGAGVRVFILSPTTGELAAKEVPFYHHPSIVHVSSEEALLRAIRMLGK